MANIVENEFITAIYDVSRPCDYRCIYCRNDWLDENNQSHIDFEKIKKNLDGVKKNGFYRVIFTGGEFFIIPYWKDIIEYSANLGLEIWIITNGYAIDHDDIKFIKKYIKRINISFHAHNKSLYNKIMRPPSKDAFDIVLQNMKVLHENGIEISIFFSPVKLNVEHLYDTIKKIYNYGIKISNVNVNRIVKTQSTQNYFKYEGQLDLFDHKKLVLQAYKINKELKINTALEAYPYCFLKRILDNIEDIKILNQPCYLGRIAIAFNSNGTMKLCPATHFSISKSISTLNILSNNKTIQKFKSNKWRNEICRKCKYWNDCLGGCHAANGQLFSDDPLLIDDEIKLVKGIDITFFDILISLYNPFLSSAYKKASIQYTIFSKKYSYPVGIVALNRTKSGGHFFEIALIPDVKGKFYSFLAISEFVKLHPFDKIGWTVHKANLPSIKLLQKLGGGFFPKTVNNRKRIEAEGFFRPNNLVSKSMRDSLKKLVPESTEKFKKWIKEYETRKKELNDLKKYLMRYSNENN